jgi:hypothetical protein
LIAKFVMTVNIVVGRASKVSFKGFLTTTQFSPEPMWSGAGAAVRMWAVPAQSHASSKYQRFLDTEVKKIVRSPSARAGLEAVANRNFDGGMAE